MCQGSQLGVSLRLCPLRRRDGRWVTTAGTGPSPGCDVPCRCRSADGSASVVVVRRLPHTMPAMSQILGAVDVAADVVAEPTSPARVGLQAAVGAAGAGST